MRIILPVWLFLAIILSSIISVIGGDHVRRNIDNKNSIIAKGWDHVG